MSSKRWMHTGRRAFLRNAAGGAVALPLLELTHGHAFAEATGPKRFLTVFSHGGTLSNQSKRFGRHDGRGDHHGLDYWAPAPGESLVLGPLHQSLEPFRSKLLVLEYVDNKAAVYQDRYTSGAHGTANVTALTAANQITSGDDKLASGPSIDFVVAERLMAEQPVRFERIHLKVRGHQYGTPYYRAAREPSSGEQDPRAAFNAIFDGVAGSSGPDPAIVHRRALRRSVLDGVLEGFARFRSRASARDVTVVDAHLEGLRALERELADLPTPAMCVPPDDVSAGDTPGDVVGPLHVRVILAALRCGLTNVANLEISDILTPWTEAGIQVDSSHGIGHSLGHTAREIGATGPNASLHDRWVAEMADNRRWRIGLLRQLIEGLDDPLFAEGANTMLDNSLVLYTSEFRNGSGHYSWNVPVLMAGSVGGYFRTGRHVSYRDSGAEESRESTHNLFTSILHAFGGDDAHFGSDHALHQGPLPGLT